MIGSPDLLAFTAETDFLEQSTESLELPADLSVPLHGRAEDGLPWTRGYNKDFILISEFSEQVGPQPLLTIPQDVPACDSFDLNRFSLRIMSVDYQSTLACQANPTHAKLSFVEDSKVVLGESGAYAYVHHLTLYDAEARGFVRPFSIAYVSFEEEKIMQCFKQLSEDFSKASECLKTGNRKNFAVEVDRKLSDLEFTRLTFLREMNRDRLNKRNGMESMGGATKEQEKNENGNRDSLLTANKQELKEVQRCRAPFMEADRSDDMPEMNFNSECDRSVTNNRSDNEHEEPRKTGKAESTAGQGITWASKADELAHVEKAIQDHRSLLKQVTSYPNRKLRDPQFLPYEPFDSAESDLPCSIGSAWDHNETSPSHTPQLVSLSTLRRFDRRLKKLDELCDEYFLQQALNQLHSIERHYRGDSSYILSQERTQHLLRYLNATNFLFEHPCDLERETGQQLSGLQMPLPVSPLQSEPVSLDSYTSCVEMVPIRLELHRNGSDSFPSLSDGRNDDVAPPMKDSISSGESIEVLGTEKSVRTQAAVVTTETDLQSPTMPLAGTAEGRKRRAVTRRENSEDSIEVLSVTDSIIPDDLRASCQFAIHEETSELDGDRPDDPTCSLEDVLVQNRDEQQESRSSSSAPAAVQFPQVPHVSPLGVGSPPFLLTPDDFSDCTSYHSLASTGSTPSLELSGGNGLAGSRRKRGKLGRAALNFTRQFFPFAPHVVYSLLIGRTVVVLGSDEKAVRRLVAALTLYTPHLNSCRGSIQPWTSSPLQITDLLTWKLIGYNRSAASSSPSVPHCLVRFSRYVSVLDVDHKTLRCPTYKGSLICPLVEARTHTMRGTTYFLFAQSVISQLVSRAFLFTFSRELRHPSVPNAAVFGELHKDDLKILQYLSELIMQHITGNTSTLLRCSYTASTLIKI